MRQAVLDIRRGAAWIAAREEIDDQQLGISGISLGGLVAALAASAEPRFQKTCLVLTGGNLEKIIRESSETDRDPTATGPVEPSSRSKWPNGSGPIDPLTYAPLLQGRRVLMLNARHDKVIPPACTQAFWQAAGRPEIEWWDADHYSAIWYLPRALSRMVDFFRPERGRPARHPETGAAASRPRAVSSLAEAPCSPQTRCLPGDWPRRDHKFLGTRLARGWLHFVRPVSLARSVLATAEISSGVVQMKQAIAGVTPASEREMTVMIVWPSVAAMSLGPFPLGLWLGRLYAIKSGFYIFTLSNLFCLLTIPLAL